MNHKLKILLLFFLFVFIMGDQFLSAQEKRSITLNEAIDLSIKNSKQLKISASKIDEAKAALKEIVQKKLPDAKISGSYLQLSTANLDLKTKNNNGGNQNPPPNISQAMYGIVNFSMPIYAGSRIKFAIESSKYLEQAAKLDADNQRDEIIQNTIEAYINLFKANASVNLVKQNLVEAQQRVKDFTNMEKNGLLARNDLLKAELQSSNTELALLDVENNKQMANMVLDLLLGIQDNTELIPDSTIINQSLNPKTIDEYIQSASKNRNDVASLDFRKKAAESSVNATKGEYYPAFSLSGGYIALDIPHFLSVTNALNMGIGISYNIGSLWKTKAKLQQAEAKVKQLDLSQSLLDDQVRLQVNKSYHDWVSSQKKIQVFAKATEQANENYKIIKNKYDNSLATTTDLLDADVAQLQAKLNYVFSKADAVVAYHKLLQVSGIGEQNIKSK